MLIRIISSVLGIGLFLGMCFGGLAPFTIAVTVTAALGTGEFLTAYGTSARQADAQRPVRTSDRWLNALLAVLGALFPALAYGRLMAHDPAAHANRADLPTAVLLALLVVAFAARVPHAARTGQALGRLRACYGLIGMAWIGLLFSSLVLLRGLPGRIAMPPFGTADRGAWLMLFVAVCVWATDTFAYFVGRSVGRHKLAPALSPGKTIEGAVGGLLGASVIGALFGAWIHLSPLHGLAIGGIAGIAGQIGDLFESALKRELGIKDFGWILPGHGGVLDRFDSLLFVAPLAYLYLRCIAGL